MGGMDKSCLRQTRLASLFVRVLACLPVRGMQTVHDKPYFRKDSITGREVILMGQKMLFNHNNYKSIGPAPKESELLLDIIYNQSEDYLIRIKKNIEGFSRYKKPGTKKTLTHVQYVYRTLTNAEAFTSLFSTFSKAEKDVLAFLHDHGGKVCWDEVEHTRFTKELFTKLQSFGLVFVFPNFESPKYVVLPIEYRYLIFSNNGDKGSMLFVLRNLGTDKVKQIIFYINKKFGSNFDQSLSNVPNVAFLYNFLTTSGEVIKETLTTKQKEIISFVLQHGNDVDLNDLLSISPIPGEQSLRVSIDTIFKYHRHYYQSRQKEIKYTELQELFYMGALMFTNPYNSNKVLIPKEIFPVLAREYLVKIETSKQKIFAEIVSDVPKDKKGKSMDSLLYLLVKNIITFFLFSYTKPTQKRLLPKTAIKKCAKVLKINNVDNVDCLSIFILTEGYITSSGKKCFVLTEKGEKFFTDNMPDMDFRRAIEDFFLGTTDWNELYKAQNRVIDYYANSFNCDFKGLLYKCLKGLPHQWLKASKFMEILCVDYGFTKIRATYDEIGDAHNVYSSGQQQSEYNDLDSMFASILQTMYFLGLLDLIEGEKGISHIRLSGTAIALATNQPIKSKQKSTHTQKKLFLQPNGEVVCMQGTPQETLAELGKFAEIKKIDHTTVFELSSQSLIKGVTEFKLDFAEIIKFLAVHTGKELPQNIAYIFKQLKAKEELLTVGRCGGYIIMKDHILLEEIKNIGSIKKHIADSSELPVLFLKPDSSIKEVLRELRKKGHLPKEAKNLDIETPRFRHRYYEDDSYF